MPESSLSDVWMFDIKISLNRENKITPENKLKWLLRVCQTMITLSSDHHLSGSINMLFGKVYKYATKGISFVGQMLKNQKKSSTFKWLKNT